MGLRKAGCDGRVRRAALSQTARPGIAIPELVDTHAHLDLLDQPPDMALAEAAEAGVTDVIAVGIDIKSSRSAVAAAREFPGVFASVGIHPHDASTVDETALAELENLAKHERVVAIGEAGLDYYRDRSPRSDQRRAFIEQIRLARRLDLPLIVHTRDAGEDTLHILEEEADGLTVILHCFSLHSYVHACAARRYFMSLAGNVTFQKAEQLRHAAVHIPEDLILTETDSPFLTPVPFRGRPNSPARVGLVLAELARLRGVDEEQLAAAVMANFRRAFRI